MTPSSPAASDFRAHLDLLSVSRVQSLAVQAGITATPIASWTFCRCMESLAARYDRRSFVNACEAIHDGIINEDEMPTFFR